MFRKKIKSKMQVHGTSKKSVSRKGGKSIHDYRPLIILSGGGDALRDYTPLIKAIRERNVDRVEELLRNGADANQKDDREGWSPMKWNNYSYLHGPDHDNRSNQVLDDRITELLVRYGANMMDFDNMDSFRYDFSRFDENQNQNDEYTQRNTGGGRYRMTKKKYKYNNMKGGRSSTEADRINYALSGNYTSLINAIIGQNINEVIRVLQTGADANQRDSVYNWCPMKWASFVFYYGDNHDPNIHMAIIRSLFNANPPGRNCFDDYHIEENSYNFSPVILDIDEQLERIRRENEDIDDDNRENRRNMAGGKRRRKSRKSKKSNKKAKRGSSTKRRKHMKK